jgi:hypothetical protein
MKIFKMDGVFPSNLTIIHPHIIKFRIYGLHCDNDFQY